MAAYDYSDLTKTITITNNAPADVAMDDAGSHTGPYGVPADQVAYKSSDRFVQFFRSNVYKKLESGDTLKLIASTAAEFAYYMDLPLSVPELSVSAS